MRGDDLLLAHLAILSEDEPHADREPVPSPRERLAEALGPEFAEELVSRLTAARP